MDLKQRQTTEFFSSDYVNYASYDNLRKIASLVDGQKNAARKVLWFAQQKNLKNEIKVSQLDSKVAEATEYLHGSMAGVIVNLAQDHTGTNNINLLMPEGNFGTRLVPESSAARYIYTYGSKEFFEMFNTQDTHILEQQYFEGHQIEPKFMLPKLPMLLINGTEGISSGFAQKILPRNPDELTKYLKYYLTNPTNPKKPFKNKPFFRGYTGDIVAGEENQWIMRGKFIKKGNKVRITELPIGYNLKGYLKVLDKLEEDKRIIKYNDFSEDLFNIEIQFNKKYLDSLSTTDIIKLLKLEKKVTENYTVMNQYNQVETFNSINDIFWRYYEVKIEYLKKRKDNLISTLTEDIKELISRYVFIKSIIDNTLIITKRATKDIITDLDKLDKVIKVDGSYEYLMRQAISSLTKERMDKLVIQIRARKDLLDFTKTSTLEEMWLNDLN